MTQTQAPPGGATLATDREDLMAGLTALAIFYRTHPAAEPPDGRTLSKRVCGLTYGDKVIELDRIAASWETDVESLRDGTLLARRAFGPVTLAAVLSPPDASLAGYHARIARREAPAGNGTEAAP